MVVKTITVTEDAYNSFKQLKLPNESFSDLMKRMSSTKATVNDIFGTGKGNIDIESLKKTVKNLRRRFNDNMEDRRERLRHISTHRNS